jgi:hypothetical protein
VLSPLTIELGDEPQRERVHADDERPRDDLPQLHADLPENDERTASIRRAAGDRMTDEERGMRFSREVRIGELIAALLAISAMATGYIELRIKPLEQQIAAVDRARVADRESANEFKRELRGDLQRLESKLDRLIENIPQVRRTQ